MTDCIQVFTTFGNRADADALASELVDRRLAACVQVLGPVTSTFRWEDRLETAEEWLCLIKTTGARFDALAAHIETNHGYETPELTALPVDNGSPSYLAWLSSATANP